MSGLRSKPSQSDILKFIDPKLAEPELGVAEPSDKEGSGFLFFCFLFFSSLNSSAFSRVARELLGIEDKQQIKGYKFGVLYCKAGQEKEDEMFGNGESSLPELSGLLHC